MRKEDILKYVAPAIQLGVLGVGALEISMSVIDYPKGLEEPVSGRTPIRDQCLEEFFAGSLSTGYGLWKLAQTDSDEEKK